MSRQEDASRLAPLILKDDVDTAAAAGLGPIKEGRFLLPGCDRRPADVLLHNWAQGRDAALDVTVVTPMRQDLVEEAASTPISPLFVR